MANKKAPSNSFTDSLLSESQNFSEPEDDEIRSHDDLQGFDDDYEVHLDKNHRPYFSWGEKSEQHVDSLDFWGNTFKAKPYFDYLPNHNGVLVPNIHTIANKSPLVLDDTKRAQAYHDFLNRLGLEKEQALLPTISHFHNYRQLAFDQLNRGITELEKIDCRVQSVLKVLYYEATTNGVDVGGFVEHLYKIVARNICIYNEAKRQPLFNSLKSSPISDIILESARNGLLHNIEKKETIIKPLIPVYEKFLFLEIAIQQVLNNKEVSEADLTVLDLQKPKKEVKQNLTAQRMIRQGEENKEAREKIIETANSIIFNNKNSKAEHFFGEKGGPKKMLWDHEKMRRLPHIISESSKKRWLKEAYLKGEFAK